MKARYLIRLDDATHDMDRERWDRVEQVLDFHRVKPIVAVVPDNQDPALARAERDPLFWDRVRRWAGKGWTVAMHGHQHVMHVTGAPLVLPFYRRSEFAGLSLAEQSAKLRESWNLFQREGVTPHVWVAPAHSFDQVTLQALLRETPIRIVSDGIAWDTFQEQGFQWIPQQLWSLVRRPSGLWTVCLHPNTMDAVAIDALDRALGGAFKGQVLSVSDIKRRSDGRTVRDRIYAHYFWWRWRRARAAA